jgi:hypothetical protein
MVHIRSRSFDFAQDFGSGLGRPLNASTFEADRFNHSRTSPEGGRWSFVQADSRGIGQRRTARH